MQNFDHLKTGKTKENGETSPQRRAESLLKSIGGGGGGGGEGGQKR